MGPLEFGYQGLPRDPETGLIYFRNRYYDPELGRFITADPKGYTDGPSMYAFERNDPANGSDPLGFGAAAAAVVATEEAAEVAAPEAAPAICSTPVTAVGCAGVVGYGIGSLINEIPVGGGRNVGDAISDWMAARMSSDDDKKPVASPAAPRHIPVHAPTNTPGKTESEHDRKTTVHDTKGNVVAEGSVPAAPSPAPRPAGDRYSGRYADGQKAYRTNVPRDANNDPIPDPKAQGSHSRLQRDKKDPSRIYSATEFNAKGEPVKRVDFAGRPGQPLPHEHAYNPKTKKFEEKHPTPKDPNKE